MGYFKEAKLLMIPIKDLAHDRSTASACRFRTLHYRGNEKSKAGKLLRPRRFADDCSAKERATRQSRQQVRKFLNDEVAPGMP
jgi:hypothetical protein